MFRTMLLSKHCGIIITCFVGDLLVVSFQQDCLEINCFSVMLSKFDADCDCMHLHIICQLTVCACKKTQPSTFAL